MMPADRSLSDRISERALNQGKELVARQIAATFRLHTDPEQFMASVAALAYAHIITAEQPEIDFGKASRLGSRLYENHGPRMFSFANLQDDQGTAA